MSDGALWLCVVLLGVLVEKAVFTTHLEDFGFDWTAFMIGLAMLVGAVFGIVLHWGPMVPCVFLGMLFASALSSPVSSSYEERVYNMFVVPILGAILGALGGALWEWLRSAESESTENVD